MSEEQMTTDANLMVMVAPTMEPSGTESNPNETTSQPQTNGSPPPPSAATKKKRKSPTKKDKPSSRDGDTAATVASESVNKAAGYRKMTDPERYHVFAAAMQAKALHGSVGARDQQYSKEMYNTTIEILESTVDLHGLKGSLLPGYTTIRGLLTKFYNTGYVSREIGGGGCLRWGCRLSGKGTGGKCLCHQKAR